MAAALHRGSEEEKSKEGKKQKPLEKTKEVLRKGNALPTQQKRGPRKKGFVFRGVRGEVAAQQRGKLACRGPANRRGGQKKKKVSSKRRVLPRRREKGLRENPYGEREKYNENLAMKRAISLNKKKGRGGKNLYKRANQKKMDVYYAIRVGIRGREEMLKNCFGWQRLARSGGFKRMGRGISNGPRGREKGIFSPL